jgi:EmrB/QacA subfamily drug resistance transporter
MWYTYLLGVLMGAMDGGILAPALTSILNTFNIEYKWGVWTVTIYTLIFAVSMPIVGKLADRFGRKKVFMISISLFAVGSLFSAYSQSIGQLLIARGIQAIGGGGIIPIATAEIQRNFPQEKRGLALGIVGSVFAIAILFSPIVGSFLMNTWDWRAIFLINVPISLIILLFSRKLEESKVQTHRPLDLTGTILLSLMILGFMFGFTNMDPTNIKESLFSPEVWPFLIMSLGWAVPFAMAQRSARDPIIKIEYFFNRDITLLLIISMVTGVGMMAMIFIPAFAENLLGWQSGLGGYVVIILALSAALASWTGGKLLDKMGGRPVIFLGFALFIIGSLMLGTVVTEWIMLSVSLLFVGTGIGLTIGAPIQYLMLQKVSEEETTSALAIIQLFRSLGTTLGPTLMVAFVTRATVLIPETVQKTVLSTLMPPGGAPGAATPNLSQPLENWNELLARNGITEPNYPSGTEAIRDWLENLVTSPEQQIIVEELLREIQMAIHLGYQDMFLAAALIGSIGLILTFGIIGHISKNEI